MTVWLVFENDACHGPFATEAGAIACQERIKGEYFFAGKHWTMSRDGRRWWMTDGPVARLERQEREVL